MNINCIEPAIDPSNRITFLLDWELTMKCNLDCSYCGTDIEIGGHNNTTNHPALEDCLKTIDFMFEYVDLYMATKSLAFKQVILNVYGGEALHHPNIVQILTYIKQQYQLYQDKWSLTLTTTTNLILSENKLKKILPFIDKFTSTYHSEISEKHLLQFCDNILLLQKEKKNFTCVVLMNPKLFNKNTAMIDWLEKNQIKFLPRQLDQVAKPSIDNLYKPNQIIWFDKFYASQQQIQTVDLDYNKEVNLTDKGRACCGGRKLSLNQDYKNKTFYIKNNFYDWHCSVNHFFLFVKQVNGKIYTNKDCKMGFNGKVEPIGYLDKANELLDFTKTNLQKNSLPIIQCKKNICICGLCAPKSNDIDSYNKIMAKYKIVNE